MCAIFIFLRLEAFVGNRREKQPLVEGVGRKGRRRHTRTQRGRPSNQTPLGRFDFLVFLS